jgi:peptide/nickel transport system permease protein
LVATATYYLFNIAPGGPTAGLRQIQRRLTPQDIARIRAQYELDLYWPVRFSRWLIGFPSGPIVVGNYELLANTPVGCYLDDAETGGCKTYVYPRDIPKYHPPIKSSKGILRGDFGQSTVVRIGQPAINEILSRLPATLELGILALFFSIAIGLPIGIYSAVRQYSRFDYIATTLSFLGSAMPTFFFGLLMILLFTITPVFLQDTFPWIPRLPPGLREAVRPYSIASWWQDIQPGSFADRLLHLIMPLGVLTFFNTAQWSRFVRSSMLEVLRQDYVRTARAKGLVERVVIAKHALRNALIPFVTILVLQLPGIFGGAIITESIFAWPGMGRLYIDALNRSDYPIALAFVFIIGVLTVIATLLGDILYTVVDPRIKYS